MTSQPHEQTDSRQSRQLQNLRCPPPSFSPAPASERTNADTGGTGNRSVASRAGILNPLGVLLLGALLAAGLLWAGRLAVADAPVRHFWGRIAVFTLCGGWLGAIATVLGAAVDRGWLRGKPGASVAPRSDPLLPLRALAATALAGYLLFWFFLFNTAAGLLVSSIPGCGSLILLALPRTGAACRRLWRLPHWRVTFATTVALGFLYFGLLHLWPHTGEWNWLAAHRTMDGLPMDNVLPQLLAERLIFGQPLEPFVGDWMSSDRPPLQAAWILLAAPLLRLQGGAAFLDPFGQALGLWCQLLWWPGALALLCRLGMPLRRSLYLLAPLTLTAFPFTYSTFVWPKLAAASFVLLAWLELQALRSSERLASPGAGRRIAVRRWSLIGLWLGLGYLCHGGAAFPTLALIPFLAATALRRSNGRPHCGRQAPGLRRLRDSGIRIAFLAASFALVIAPWTAYQHWGAPPGNRLLKWHLAGSPAIDSRGTAETLRTAYANIDMPTWLRTRADNLSVIAGGGWRGLWSLSRATIDGDRCDDFFHLIRSLGWWNAGLVLLPPVLWFGRNARPRSGSQHALALSAWASVSLAAWVLLMFQPATTVLHLGSSLPPLLLLLLAAWTLRRLHAAAFWLVASASAGYFAWHYILIPPNDFPSTPSVPAAALACLAAFVLICVPLRAKALGCRK